MYSREAFKLLAPAFSQVLKEPGNLQARGHMLLGAAFAGMAIENSMLGAAHAAANPLTAHYGIVHGQAVGLLLPSVVRFNAQDQGAALAYGELASAPEIACVSEGLEEAVRALVARLETLLNVAGLPWSLADCGVEKSMTPTMAIEAAKQWIASFNPRELAPSDFEELYAAAFEQRGEGDEAG